MVVDLSFYHNVLKHLIDKTFMESQMKMEDVLDSSNIVESKTVHSISENEVFNTIKPSSELHLFDAFVCYLNDMFIKSKDTMEFIQVKCNDKKKFFKKYIHIYICVLNLLFSTRKLSNRDNVILETDIGDIILSLGALLRKLDLLMDWSVLSQSLRVCQVKETGIHKYLTYLTF
ncbi:hypothetical protein RFI_03819 [Reticulomyxa filosa]|uniref:Uncharacterized protein n=1 Tax=Reticulomyxa filosa TaxID=46433 RepID=X6P6P1_RETFI|nr:hypothetical protein RFI_03819 [Reticulomyxa filosa]|eukprot:ETO33287.1 hypothetical protein RFI_03819 [Reticulomyxa filosa]